VLNGMMIATTAENCQEDKTNWLGCIAGGRTTIPLQNAYWRFEVLMVEVFSG